MESLLITGASGFIGGWLVRAALQRGHRLRAQYRRATPPPQLAALAGPRSIPPSNLARW